MARASASASSAARSAWATRSAAADRASSRIRFASSSASSRSRAASSWASERTLSASSRAASRSFAISSSSACRRLSYSASSRARSSMSSCSARWRMSAAAASAASTIASICCAAISAAREPGPCVLIRLPIVPGGLDGSRAARRAWGKGSTSSLASCARLTCKPFMQDRYDPKQIEPKWQRVWAEEHTWEVSNEPDERPSQDVLEIPPCPSGEPHMGHLKCYSIGDAIAHYRRRTGHRVLHPMGYDAFGLPAENHAIKTGQHPRESTATSIESFRTQMREWGISIDWTREFGTHQPEYYRWTQW